MSYDDVRPVSLNFTKRDPIGVHIDKAVERKKQQGDLIEQMFDEWRPLLDKLDRAFAVDPNLHKREVLAKMFLDVARKSLDAGNTLKSLEAIRRMYGHDASTVRHEDAAGSLDERIERYRKELMDQVLEDVTLIDGQVIVVKSDGNAGK